METKKKEESKPTTPEQKPMKTEKTKVEIKPKAEKPKLKVEQKPKAEKPKTETPKPQQQPKEERDKPSRSPEDILPSKADVKIMAKQIKKDVKIMAKQIEQEIKDYNKKHKININDKHHKVSKWYMKFFKTLSITILGGFTLMNLFLLWMYPIGLYEIKFFMTLFVLLGMGIIVEQMTRQNRIINELTKVIQQSKTK